MEYVTTTCPYCGTGCGLNLIVVNGKAVGVAPYHRSPVSSGKLCTRGLHAAKALTEWRIEKPCVRGESVTWDVALTEAKKISGYSGDEIAVANWCGWRRLREVHRKTLRTCKSRCCPDDWRCDEETAGYRQ